MRITSASILLSTAAFLLCGASFLKAQQAGTGYLKTKIVPGRAGVFLDGKYLGPAANFRIGRKYTVPAGEHELKLIEPRYQEFTTKVTIAPGKTTTVSQTLQPAEPAKPPFGRLKVKGNQKYAAVYVNDRFMGHTDEFNGPGQGLLLNPGEYSVKIVPVTGGQEHTEKITIAAETITVVDLKQ